MDSLIGTRRVHARAGGAVLAAAALIAVACPTGPASAMDTTAAPSAVVSAHPVVIAQRVVPFGDGPHHWSIEQRVLEPAVDPTAWTAPTSEFIVAARGSAVVTDGSVKYLLAAGEALYVPGGAAVTASATGNTAAAVYLIDILAGPPSGAPTEVGGTFTPGAGAHDVDLLAVVMDIDGTALFPASPVAPVLTMVITGSADVNGDPLATGEAETVDADVALTNTSDGQSVAVAVSIGASFDGGIPPDPVVTGDPDEDPDNDGDGDNDSAPTTTDATATTTEAPTTTAPVDTDGDGLTDAEEATLGTNPAVPDTDGDGLGDGLEVNQHGTDPLTSDGDGDTLTDLDEVSNGTDGRNNDTDGDGASDGQEVREIGSSPLKVDTDGDGFTDVEELIFGTSPTNPDTDGDGVNDKDEGRNGNDPTDPNG